MERQMKIDRGGVEDDEIVTNRDGTYTELVHVSAVRPLDGFRAHVTFTDGSERDIDLEPYLHGPVFEPIRNDPQLFRAMRVEGGTITWPDEVDIAPETLYYEGAPPWAETAER